MTCALKPLVDICSEISGNATASSWNLKLQWSKLQGHIYAWGLVCFVLVLVFNAGFVDV